MEIVFDSQRLSNEYLCVNSCGTEIALDRDIPTNRPLGRVDYHILYIEKGVCTIWLDDKSLDVSQGNIIIYRPGQPQHYCLRAGLNSVSKYIHFSGTGCKKLMSWFTSSDECVFYVGQSESCHMLLERIAQEMVFRTELYEQLCAAYLNELLILFQRRARSVSDKSILKSEKRIGDICLKIQREFNIDIPIDEYAAQSCLSPSRFAHLFKEQVGCSPIVYRNKLRLSHAKELLIMTDLPVMEIGRLVGFTNAAYFSRLFTSVIGCSPSEFRRKA